MAYDETLADRVRTVLAGRPFEERKMFGGLAFLFLGNMGVGIVDRELMVRVGPDAHESALARPHARPMDFTGKPMTGYVFVSPRGVAHTSALRVWVLRGADYAGALPTKNKTVRKRASRAARPPRPHA